MFETWLGTIGLTEIFVIFITFIIGFFVGKIIGLALKLIFVLTVVALIAMTLGVIAPTILTSFAQSLPLLAFILNPLAALLTNVKLFTLPLVSFLVGLAIGGIKQ